MTTVTRRKYLTVQDRAPVMELAAKIYLTFDNANKPLNVQQCLRSAVHTLFPEDGEERFGIKGLANRTNAEFWPIVVELREKFGIMYHLDPNSYKLVGIEEQAAQAPAQEPVDTTPQRAQEQERADVSEVAKDPVSVAGVLDREEIDRRLGELQVDFVASLNRTVGCFVQDALDLMQKKIALATDDLLVNSLSAMQELMDESLRKAVSGITAHREHIDDVPKSEKRIKPRVAILGLKGDQASMMRHEYGEHFNLRIEDQTSVYSVTRAAMKRYDLILYMANFNDHAVQERFDALPGFEILKGGMTTLRRRLDRYLDQIEEKEHAAD